MKKLAFILAIAFVFLVGEKIIFEHKIWAEGKDKKQILYWIPVNMDGEFVLDEIRVDNKFKEKSVSQKIEVPIPVEGWKEIQNLKNLSVMKVLKNPEYCYPSCSGEICQEVCIKWK